jgi:hypothetical protein
VKYAHTYYIFTHEPLRHLMEGRTRPHIRIREQSVSIVCKIIPRERGIRAPFSIHHGRDIGPPHAMHRGGSRERQNAYSLWRSYRQTALDQGHGTSESRPCGNAQQSSGNAQESRPCGNMRKTHGQCASASGTEQNSERYGGAAVTRQGPQSASVKELHSVNARCLHVCCSCKSLTGLT